MAELITRAQASDRLGVTLTTLGRWERDGTLKPALTLPGKTGARLYAAEDIEAFALKREKAKR